MKNVFKTPALFILLCIFFLSCKKDKFQNDVPSKETSSSIENVKQWYSRQLPSTPVDPASLAQKDNLPFDPKMGTPVWNKTVYDETTDQSITPIASSGEKFGKPLKYLVAEQLNNQVVQGYIYFILPDKKKGSSFPDINAATFHATAIEGFTGAIIQYDMNGTIISSKHFEDGRIVSDKSDRMLDKMRPSETKKGGENTSSFEQVCYIIDHWWVTYQDGEIIAIEWVGSEQVCVNGGGSGSGGSGPSDEAVANAAAQSIINSINPASELISYNDDVQGNLRTRMYSWKCVKSGGWYVLAYEKGVHKFKNGKWTWVSLENQGISVGGTVVGGTLTATKSFSNSTLGLYHAISQIGINVAASVTVASASITKYKDFVSHITFSVDSPYIPEE